MLDEPEKTVAELTETERNLDYWKSRPYVSEDVATAVASAQIVLVPREGHGEYHGPVFPVGTEEFLSYLRANGGSGAAADICISDDEYKEIALHSDVLRLASLVVSTAVLPIALNLVAAYVYDWIKKRSSRGRVRVESTIIVDRGDGRKTVEIRYAGPAEEYKETVERQLNAALSQDPPKRA